MQLHASLNHINFRSTFKLRDTDRTTESDVCFLGVFMYWDVCPWVDGVKQVIPKDAGIKVQQGPLLHFLYLLMFLWFALIGNYFSGLMPSFRLSVCRQEQRISSPRETSREMRHWQREDSSFLHRQRGRTAHLWSGRGFAGQRGDSCIFFSPHLNLNSILWCSYVPAWQGSGVICSIQTPGLSSCVPSQRFK